jgi:hypothetical protein
MFRSSEGAAPQEVCHLFSDHLAAMGYRNASMSVAMISIYITIPYYSAECTTSLTRGPEI